MQCPFPMSIKNKETGKYIAVPCGKCPSCQINRREDWTIRLMEEYKASKYAYFITMTYDDDNMNEGCNVVKKDLQDFFKRFRHNQETKITYYAIGEYGTKLHRPHYHILLFMLEPLNYDKLQQKWGKGLTHVGGVNIKSISYVCKYHINRTTYPEGREPPFCLSSKLLGIQYVAKMQEYHSEDTSRAYYQQYEFKKKIPRYYKDKIYSKEEKEKISLAIRDQSDKKEVNDFNRLLKRFTPRHVTKC